MYSQKPMSWAGNWQFQVHANRQLEKITYTILFLTPKWKLKLKCLHSCHLPLSSKRKKKQSCSLPSIWAILEKRAYLTHDMVVELSLNKQLQHNQVGEGLQNKHHGLKKTNHIHRNTQPFFFFKLYTHIRKRSIFYTCFHTTSKSQSWYYFTII